MEKKVEDKKYFVATVALPMENPLEEFLYSFLSLNLSVSFLCIHLYVTPN